MQLLFTDPQGVKKPLVTQKAFSDKTATESSRTGGAPDFSELLTIGGAQHHQHPKDDSKGIRFAQPDQHLFALVQRQPLYS